MRTTCAVLVIIVSVVSVNCNNFQAVTRAGILDYLVGGFNHITNLVQDTFSVFTTQNVSEITSTEDASMNITDLAAKYGYPIEEHHVTTEDGFIITLHRIPRGKTKIYNNLVVFLMHGLIESSDSWVLQGPDKALAYILADKGFDVWMGNARGNKYAQQHLTLNPKDHDFWEFTWEEIGIYDLPTMIDYVLHSTKKESLHYVGYSQGATSFYVLNSMKPEYNQKFKMMFALAPVAFLSNVKSPLIKMFSPASNLLAYFLNNYNVTNTKFFNTIADTLCNTIGLGCSSMLDMIVGHTGKEVTDTMAVVLGHMPTTSSMLQLVHFGQLVQSGRFCHFDFGEQGNMETYGRTTPPDYDLSKVTVPNVVFFSENDWLADPIDVRTLLGHLPNVFKYHYLEDFNHLDLIYASAARDTVYSVIVSYILDFENKNISDLQNTGL